MILSNTLAYFAGASVTGEERVLMTFVPDLAQSHLRGLADSQRLLHSRPQRLQQGFRRQLCHQGPILLNFLRS